MPPDSASGVPILQTERLVLSPWHFSDWVDLRPIATDVEVMRYINGGVPWADERIQAFVNRQVELFSERGFCRWKLLLKTGQEMIGFCGVGFWGDALDPEIGWWLAPSYWGRGIATEAARVALAHVFERTGLERIISIARPENKASTRIMERLGFTLEWEFEKDGVRLVRYAIERPRR